MAPQNQPMAAYRGHRRHRFMEASDFNAAAKRIFEHLRRAVIRGDSVGPAFMTLMMDPTTPGFVETLACVSTDTGRLADALNSASDPMLAMNAGFDCLLKHPEGPAPLAAYVGPAHVLSRPALGASSQSFALCLEIRSVDASAVVAYRLLAGGKKLEFAPLKFRGRR
jgi:hypothetical protein